MSLFPNKTFSEYGLFVVLILTEGLQSNASHIVQKVNLLSGLECKEEIRNKINFMENINTAGLITAVIVRLLQVQSLII